MSEICNRVLATQTLDLESKQKADEAVYANDLAEVHAQTIDDLFADLEDADPDDDDSITNWLGSLQTSGSTIGTVATTEQSARSGRNSANTTALNNLKATLKTERETAEKAADRLYRNTEQSAWNAYLTSVQSANTTYLGSIKTSENTYKSASDSADATYRAASVTAYTNYHQTIHTLDTAFYAAVSDATDPTFTTTTYFNTVGANPNLPYQKTTLVVQNKSQNISERGTGRDPDYPCAQISITSGTTIAQLATEIGLDANEWKEWLKESRVKLINGTWVSIDNPSLTSDSPLAEQSLLIPNTLICVLYDDKSEEDGSTKHLREDWSRDIAELKLLKFHVVPIDATKGDVDFTDENSTPPQINDSAVIKTIQEYSNQKRLHGILIYGHGKPGLMGSIHRKEYLGKRTIAFQEIKSVLSYSLGAAVFFGCRTIDATTESGACNDARIFRTHEGMVFYGATKEEGLRESTTCTTTLGFPHAATLWGRTQTFVLFHDFWIRGGKQLTGTFTE